MTYMTIDHLTATSLAEEDHDVPGRGKVRIRAVSRIALLQAGKGVNEDKDPALIERRMLVAALVEPAITMEAAAGLQKAWPTGHVQDLLMHIRRLSGMDEGAPKSGV